MTNTIQHFTHNHPLTEVNVVGTYTCNGCKLDGEGKTYRCNNCDYDLHEFCATCPTILRNSCHGPDHELKLYSGPTHMTERSCYVCRFYIQGMFYICKHCNFESHPLCTYVPMHTSSLDATVTKQRSLHDHVGQPSSPQHYGQGNPYGYAIPYPYGGHHYQHHHQYQYQDSNVNMGSPKADPKKDPSTPKKKKGGVLRAIGGLVAIPAEIVTNLVIATVTDSILDEE